MSHVVKRSRRIYLQLWGAQADTFGVEVGASAVQEPSTWAMMMLGFAGLGYVVYRRRGLLKAT